MNSPIEPNGDFIEQWLDARREKGELDQRILGLVDKHLTSGELSEAGLLKSLIALAKKKSEDSNAPH